MNQAETASNLARMKEITGTAVFSTDRDYRYLLTRKWSKGNNSINWVLCNPSTADERYLDPTVAKCLEWSIRWGYNEMIITNIFALRSTDPSYLTQVKDPIGPENNRYLMETFERCHDTMIIAGWSNKGNILNRSKQVLELAKSMQICLNCLKINKTGEPCHPLYLSKSLKPIVWRNRATPIDDI